MAADGFNIALPAATSAACARITGMQGANFGTASGGLQVREERIPT